METFIENFMDAVGMSSADMVSPSTLLVDLEVWNSLSVVNFIVMADEEYDVVLDPKVVKKCITIQDLYNITCK